MTMLTAAVLVGIKSGMYIQVYISGVLKTNFLHESGITLAAVGGVKSLRLLIRSKT